MVYNQPSFRTAGIVPSLSWMRPLQGQVKSLLTIGYMTSECFALMWILSATTATILEIDQTKFEGPMGAKDEREMLEKLSPDDFPPNSVSLVAGDITSGANILTPSTFDLVYCSDTLYFLQDDPAQVTLAIRNMIALVKPDGWIVAVEPKYKAEFAVEQTTMGPLPVRLSEPEDMAGLFLEEGLTPDRLAGAPTHSYVFRKPM